MTRDEAYKYGYERGQEAAKYTDFDPDRDESRRSAAFESEENSRHDADFIVNFSLVVTEQSEEICCELWGAYDNGVADGIDDFIRDEVVNFCKQNGITAEREEDFIIVRV